MFYLTRRKKIRALVSKIPTTKNKSIRTKSAHIIIFLPEHWIFATIIETLTVTVQRNLISKYKSELRLDNQRRSFG